MGGHRSRGWRRFAPLHHLLRGSELRARRDRQRDHLCGGGPAFASGTGGLEGDQLVFPAVVLACPGGTEVDLAVSYERDPLNGTLVETAVVGDRTLPNIIFHKISR
jgi:hypothetical protein